jgi:hypothetical protein
MKKLFIGTMLLFGVVTGVIAQELFTPELITNKEDLQNIILNSEYSCYTVSRSLSGYWEDPEDFRRLKNPLLGQFFCYKQVMPDKTSLRLLFITQYDKEGNNVRVDFIFYQNDEEGFYHAGDPNLIEQISDKKNLYENILRVLSYREIYSPIYEREVDRLWDNYAFSQYYEGYKDYPPF